MWTYKPRMAGCTLVFTSPSKQSYDTPYKQQRNHSTIRYMPVWSVDEVLTHRTKLFPNSSEDQIRLGHSLLGGSLRWLGQLLNSKGDLDVAARDMVQQSMHNCTYDNLSAAASSVPSDMQGGQSHMSLLLQIHLNVLLTNQLPSLLSHPLSARRFATSWMPIAEQHVRASSTHVWKYLPSAHLLGAFFKMRCMRNLHRVMRITF